MKGVLILTEGRSGSNWLGSLTNATGFLGNSSEWFTRLSFGKVAKDWTGEQFIAKAILNASTPNGFFSIKLFPAHLHWFWSKYNIDLMSYFVDNHDVIFVRLSRRDRLRQAISYVRGFQTKQWSSESVKRRDAKYDFSAICRCYFMIDRSYQYWNSYLSLRGLTSREFMYEDLVGAPMPFIEHIANHAGMTELTIPDSSLSVQRDSVTEDWHARFQEELGKRGIVEFSSISRPAIRNLANLWRFLRGKQLRPYS